ncbi:MAG TPA: DUF5994 family protein [Pseudonocardia sp.]|jgi:hypothetical protein|nr:DUF5994 family protein [Pseudonocardia sp.]
MTSAPNSTIQRTDTARVALKPDLGARSRPTGFVDGAWWPESRDLAAQVPALLEALPAGLGRIERVSYNLDSWDTTTRGLRVDGTVVHLAGYRTQNRDTVDVIGRDELITLLVVPPDTAEDAAHRAMQAASSAGNKDGISALLATAG